jgi:glycine dehydrogenase subunit 1
MPYLYHTDEDRREMLAAIGLKSEDDLFDAIPARLRLKDELAIERGKTESETLRYLAALGAKNKPAGGLVSFLGGGIYDHEIPTIVDHLSSRSEFYTAYTPYQGEVSQGTLQVIFEYQSLISRLIGLPVANASMYDAATKSSWVAASTRATAPCSIPTLPDRTLK